MMTCHDVIPCLLMFVNPFTLICIVKGHGKGRNDGIDKGGCAQNGGETSGHASEITASCSEFLYVSLYPMAKRRNVCRQAIRKDGSLEFSVENSRNWWILDGFK